MKFKHLLLFFIALSNLSASFLGPLSSDEKAELNHPQVNLHYNIPSYTRDAIGMVQMPFYVGATDRALEAVYSYKGTPEVLDIFAGAGSFLKQLLRDERAWRKTVNYTAVDYSSVHAQTIRGIWKSKGKKLPRSKGGIAEKRYQDFYTTKPETKAGKYDIIFCGFGLHTLRPNDFLEGLLSTISMLKPDGMLIMTQSAPVHPMGGGKWVYVTDYLQQALEYHGFPFWNKKLGCFVSDSVLMRRFLKPFNLKTMDCSIHCNVVRRSHPQTGQPFDDFTGYLSLVLQKPADHQLDQAGIEALKAEMRKAERGFSQSGGILIL